MSKIDIHHLTKKQRKQMHGWLRAIIQLLYFLFLPSAYTAAFAGVKYIFLWIRLCIRKFWGCSALCLCVDLQKNQEKAGETAGNSNFKTLKGEIRCAGCDCTPLLQRCVQSDTGVQSMGCFLYAACL